MAGGQFWVVGCRVRGGLPYHAETGKGMFVWEESTVACCSRREGTAMYMYIDLKGKGCRGLRCDTAASSMRAGY